MNLSLDSYNLDNVSHVLAHLDLYEIYYAWFLATFQNLSIHPSTTSREDLHVQDQYQWCSNFCIYDYLLIWDKVCPVLCYFCDRIMDWFWVVGEYRGRVFWMYFWCVENRPYVPACVVFRKFIALFYFIKNYKWSNH